jgi:hypothetical protein
MGNFILIVIIICIKKLGWLVLGGDFKNFPSNFWVSFMVGRDIILYDNRSFWDRAGSV